MATIIYGTNGNDTLQLMSAGSGTLVGARGNDTYIIRFGDDVEIVELAGEGTDVIRTEVSYVMDDNVENMFLTGGFVINGTGNASANTITGNYADNTLDGGAGADVLIGGLGNDTYIVDLLASGTKAVKLEDKITEAKNGGIDTLVLRSSALGLTQAATVTLAAEIENLDASGTGTNLLNLTGNAAANMLIGNDASNTLDGGKGADQMHGGDGDDVYIFDDAGDRAHELADEGNDLIRITYANTNKTTPIVIDLNDHVHIEGVTIAGTGLFNIIGTDNGSTMTGNASVNTITGGAGNDVIDGGAGADYMEGGAGDDTYFVDNVGDVIVDTAGTDEVRSSLSYTLGAGLENLTLLGTAAINATGNAQENFLIGNTGNNTLDGGAGADMMAGGKGNDTYIIDNFFDIVWEQAGEGTDTIRTHMDYMLQAHFENLEFTGTYNVSGLGNELANTITGNSGNNTLDGGDGVDVLIGGLGDDTYHVDLLTSGTKAVVLEDKIIEAKNAGVDTLYVRGVILGLTQAATVTLAANIENLDISGTGPAQLNLLGNADANTMVGNSANNTLDGGKGADEMRGGLGDDVYIFDDIGDTAVEISGQGNDLIRINYANTSKTEATWILMDSHANVEGITIAGTGLFNIGGTDAGNTMTGNASVNTILGGAGNDVLDGGAGADYLEGRDGDDTYFVDNVGDVIVDTSGTDDVHASVSYTLAAGLENLTLTGTGAINGTGNASDNTIVGNAGNNSLDGGAGADRLIGGKGNDTYVVDNYFDTVIEQAGEGTDTVRTHLNYVMGDHFENLVLTGTDNVVGFGNELVNTITGNSGNNTLDGSFGVDALIGGLGDDTYVVDLLSSGGKTVKLEDKITEAKNGGTDTLQLRLGAGFSLTTAATLTLQNEIENLDASDTGTALLNLKGNAAANVITGNAAANVIDGLAGNDILFGGDGNDTLLGGAGNDQLFGQSGADVMTGGAGRDRYFYESGGDSNLAEMDRITDFNITDDRITLKDGAGYNIHTGVAYAYQGSVAATVSYIQLNEADDQIYFFTDGTNGYVYVHGNGNGAVGYDGMLVRLDGRTAPIGFDAVEQAIVFETEGARATFNPGDTVLGSLSAFGDVDEFVVDTGDSGQLTINFNAPTNFMPSQPAYKVSVLTLDGGVIMEWTTGGDRTFTLPVENSQYVVRVEGYQSSRFSAEEYSFTTSLREHAEEEIGDTVTGVISTPGQVNSYSYEFSAGQLYTFNLSPVGASLDLKIRIFDPTGREVFVKDDTNYYQIGEGDVLRLDPNGGFIAPVSGDYTVTVEAVYTPDNPIKDEITNTSGNEVVYSGMSQTGNYHLTIDEMDLEDMAANIIQGPRWESGAEEDRGTPVTINYSFDSGLSSEMVANGGSLSFLQMNSFKSFTAAQQQVVRGILAEISQVAGITFNEVGAGEGDLNFGWMKSNMGDDGTVILFDESGYARFAFDDSPYAQFEISSAFVAMIYEGSNVNSLKLDSGEMKFVLVHEILHALGLQHSGVYSSGYGPQVGVQEGMDSNAYSLLSYLGKLDSALDPATPQLLDVIALQTLYGAPSSANSGDTVYAFNSKTTEYLQSIVDTDGLDTIDASGQTLGSIIHLQGGAFSSIGIIGKISDVSAADLAKATVPGEFLDQARYNISIAPGSVIENAIGGSGNDYISGNAANNILKGGAGSDILLGEDGNDLLFGGFGADILTGGDGADRFVFDNLDGVDTVTDFEYDDGDVLEIGNLLSGFDEMADNIADFVRLTENGENTYVDVRVTGTGSWTHLATLVDVTGLGSAQDLLDNGNIGVNTIVL